MRVKKYFFVAICLLLVANAGAQTPSAIEIVKRVDENHRGKRMSSSVMGQSWMGSDFTNEDMMRESSIVNDYTHKLVTP